jgi:multidrug efflux pump subunit AcrA (membrane-fusion protein)
MVSNPMSITSSMTNSSKQGGMRMWPSVEAASWIYDIANTGLIIGLVLGVVCTVLVIWMGNIKEEHLNRALADSRLRTASLEKQSAESRTDIAKANADAAQSLAAAKQAEANLAGANSRAEEARAGAAKAYARSDEAKAESAKSFERATEAQRQLAESNERAARAEQKAAEAKLELEKFRAPRVLSVKEQQLIISRISKFTGQEYLVTTFWDLKESLDFANQLHRTLLSAGWKYIPHGEGGSLLLGGVAGVQVWVHPEADSQVKAAADALILALEEIGKAPTLKLQNPKNAKDNRIHLNIGTKL